MYIACSGVASEEVQRERIAEAVVQHSQHASLHPADHLTGVRLISDEDKVHHFRRIHFLVLAGYQHGCHSY